MPSSPFAESANYIRSRYLPVQVESGRWRIVDRREGGLLLPVSATDPEPLEFHTRADAHAHLREAGLSWQTYISTEPATG